MTTDELWEQIVLHPEDHGLKLVLADALEETGDDPIFSRGLRWCAKYDRWPAPNDDDHEFWSWKMERISSDHGRNSIPVWMYEIFQSIRSSSYMPYWRAGLMDAIRLIGMALIEVEKHL